MMTKPILTELAVRLGRDKKSSQLLLDALRQALVQSCARQQAVAIPGFGTFEAVKQDERIVTDLVSGQRMLLPPEITISFTAASKLRKMAQNK